MTKGEEATALMFDPWAGDMDSDAVTMRDGFVFARVASTCVICFGPIRVGDRVRAQTQRSEEQRKAMTFRFCPKCCRGMARDGFDRSMEQRYALGMKRARKAPAGADKEPSVSDSRASRPSVARAETWPCPRCGSRNPLLAVTCSTCVARAEDQEPATGIPDKATSEVKAFCGELLSDPAYRKSLKRRLLAGDLAPAMETLLFYYFAGKPKETVALTGKSFAELVKEAVEGTRP